MNVKKLIIINLVILLGCVFILLLVFKDKDEAKLNIIEVNDIVQTLGQNWDSLKDNELATLNYDLDFVVLDNDNNFIDATRDGLNTEINKAIINRDTIIDIKVNGTVFGKLIIYNDTNVIMSISWTTKSLFNYAYVAIL